jgi:hypothetical protein
MAKLPWKPWHEVVQLRDDLRAGDLPMHMFAADLYEVAMQSGKRPVYEDPKEFFALTYPTWNLRQLVKDVVLRLAGKNDKAVRQLELTYGGGKTHTLITLLHMVRDPAALPNLQAVTEFKEAIGVAPPKCRVAALCFDKLDVEKGMEVRDPDGDARWLRHPWSVLAYQIAGNKGLQLLHAENDIAERESAPAENLLTDLLALPAKEGLGTLVLIDEVLMYAREKVALDKTWQDKLTNFFQYLTQAAAKVDRCCIVASLLATDPKKSDTLGKEVLGDLYGIFQRQREAAVEPVVKEDVAEVLRRRFFKPESLKDKDAFRAPVQAALMGIQAVDDQTQKQGAAAEERFLRSYPFHPDLTEVLYSKWTQLSRFQRTRGVLRTFALALRDAEKWDQSPLIGPAALLAPEGTDGLSEAMNELVSVADTEESEGKKQAWRGILDSDFVQARAIQAESVGCRSREIEQAVVATFLHSQPIGQSAKTRDLLLLLGPNRPDKIELEKALVRWAQLSYWLDDSLTSPTTGPLPTTWRLGNRPNLTQMQSNAAKGISAEQVEAKLLDEIGDTKSLTSTASAAGVKVSTLPVKPKDVDDDGKFQYVVLGPKHASESGKPSPEATRYLDETSGSDKPRVYRNAMILLVPSKDGLELARAAVRGLMAWEVVRDDLKAQQKDGNIDAARATTLQLNIDKARKRIPDAIRQAYAIVVTVNEKNEAFAFKITVTDDPHFGIVKADKRSRIQEKAVTAEALLPEGPYNLWRDNETARRVKDLAGAFAQMPHLPKMLKASAIIETLASGCAVGTFALRLTRPDGTSRVWWMARPDENALADSSLELVLAEHAELFDLAPDLLTPKTLPGLWDAGDLTLEQLNDYFSGTHTVTVTRDGYPETRHVPKATAEVVEQAVAAATDKGLIWVVSPPASFWKEPVPAGVLTPTARLRPPPPARAAAELLPANLPAAWKNGETNALALLKALSAKAGEPLPWPNVRDAITAALSARFLVLEPVHTKWPCGVEAAGAVRLVAAETIIVDPPWEDEPTCAVAEKELTSSEVQDFGDLVPKLLEVKNNTGAQLRFWVKLEASDGKGAPPSAEVVEKLNGVLAGLGVKLA